MLTTTSDEEPETTRSHRVATTPHIERIAAAASDSDDPRHHDDHEPLIVHSSSHSSGGRRSTGGAAAAHEEDGRFPRARHILGLMGFLGFANVYAMRVNLSVAVVAMVNHTAIPSFDNASATDVCPMPPISNSTVPSVSILME